MTEHNYDSYRLKKLTGFDIDTKKYNTYKKLKKLIIDDSESANKFFAHIKKDERNQVKPNIILFLKQCGFDMEGCLRKNIIGNNSKYFDIVFDSNTIYSTQYPVQVYYTHKIFEKLMKNNYFKENYTEGDFLDEEFVKVERKVINQYANYGLTKYLDISIHSKLNKDKHIFIEINEYEHHSKQTEDKKRCDDIKYRNNVSDLDFIGPFVLMLNKNCEVVESEIERLTNNVVEWLQILDNCANKEKFIINYLVANGVGDYQLCEMLYNAHENKENFDVTLNVLLIKYFADLFNKKVKMIMKNFVEYRKDYVERLRTETKQNCNLNFIEINGEVKLNFDGISDFFQYLACNEDLFKFQQDHNSISIYFYTCQRTMMKAINELFVLQQKLLDKNKLNFFYGSYE